jgi:PhnB protein
MQRKVNPIPMGYHTVTPYITVKGADRAIEFYKRAFGATEISRMPGPDGRIGHAEIKLGDSHVFLSDEYPEMDARSPETLGGSPVGLFLYLEDVDVVFQRAVSAGAQSVRPPADMFWGDRYGTLRDPFGHVWHVATHIEDVSPEEMTRRAAEAMAAQPQS